MTSHALRLADLGATPSASELKLPYCIEPLQDPRWDIFLEEHPRSSLFHSSAWLNALWLTYGHRPIVYTTSPPGDLLQNGIVFCRVKSWVTGYRLVSLPFSDHCEPLVDDVEDWNVLSAALETEFKRERFNYLEIRPLGPFELPTSLCHTAVTFAFHKLDLAPDIDTIFGNLHKSSTQRKIRRAYREGLTYREGSTKELLDEFYRLFTLSRKRQGLAPQSKKWFATLMDCFGDALKIRVALKGEQTIAAIITIRYKDTLTYKYGCCDARFNNLGCMHLLFWNTIRRAKASGLRYLDFGRTDADQEGLITFKNRWGAAQSVLTYSRYGIEGNSTHLFDLYSSKWKARTTKYALKHVSAALLPTIGSIVYRHIG